MRLGFDPDFDDTAWTDEWAHVPIAEVPPGTYSDGSRVVRRVLHDAEVFGRPYRLAAPLDCRFLYDPRGSLWMSTTPQERIMMYNNGRRSRGHVLVGGLGLGLYPQYAAAGMAYHAEAIILVPPASAGMRASAAFAHLRRLTRVHQDFLVFVKGSPKAAALRAERLPERIVTDTIEEV